MYCGNCFRDNALVAALRKLGHSTLMVPLYLPMTLDEPDQASDMPIFFSGINVYLEQKSGLFRHAPDWLHRLLASRKLLKWVSRKEANTQGEEVAEITLSMLRGEEGYQARELNELIDWLKRGQQPDVVCLSNALLLGLSRALQQDLQRPVVCMLQGEDYFLDQLPSPQREAAWKALTERVVNVDLFVAPSRFFADRMGQRLGIPDGRIRVVPNGIPLDGFEPAPAPPTSPVVGYFARMSPEKGLDHLVDAFIALKKRPEWHALRLKVGGGLSSKDEGWINGLKERLQKAGCAEHAEFCPNLNREEKIEFLRSLTVLSTPALYGEAFGLYVLEALAAGVPVVQPRDAAFPELIEATTGGILYDPGDPNGLVNGLHHLLSNPDEARQYARSGREATQREYSVEQMAGNMVRVFHEATETTREKATTHSIS